MNVGLVVDKFVVATGPWVHHMLFDRWKPHNWCRQSVYEKWLGHVHFALIAMQRGRPAAEITRRGAYKYLHGDAIRIGNAAARCLARERKFICMWIVRRGEDTPKDNAARTVQYWNWHSARRSKWQFALFLIAHTQIIIAAARLPVGQPQNMYSQLPCLCDCSNMVNNMANF